MEIISGLPSARARPFMLRVMQPLMRSSMVSLARYGAKSWGSGS